MNSTAEICLVPAGADAFSVAGPQAWNALPADINLNDSRVIFRKKNSIHTFQTQLLDYIFIVFLAFIVVFLYGAAEPL